MMRVKGGSEMTAALAHDPLTNSVYCNKLNMRVYRNKPGREDKMADVELGTVQERFADIVWAHEPVASGELVKLCARELHWKKPTTYTVLRKLCEKGLFRNADGVVTSLVSREAFYAAKSRQIVEASFRGSLPVFVAAFTAGNRLTEEEADEIRKLIDAARREG